MGKLRDRMEDDLKLKGFSANTQRCYLRCVRHFAAHCRRSPALLGEREIRTFLLHLVEEKKASPATQHMHVAAIKFLYAVTLGRPEAVEKIPFPKVPQRLPDILTGSEAERLIACVTSIKYRAMVAVAYGAGLRISEVCRLKPADIDSARGLIHVREGKGRKAREIMLGEKLLALLRQYWRVVRPQGEWLFPSMRSPFRAVSARALRKALCQAADAARITKMVTPHLLRHSFASHLLEMGTDMGLIQLVLGHSSLRTTGRHTRVRAELLRRIKSPLDAVGTPQGAPLR